MSCRAQAGFTLIEQMIVVAIIGIASLAVGGSYIDSWSRPSTLGYRVSHAERADELMAAAYQAALLDESLAPGERALRNDAAAVSLRQVVVEGPAAGTLHITLVATWQASGGPQTRTLVGLKAVLP